MGKNPFVGSIKVVYGQSNNDRPDDIVREINGLSPNINYGFGGDRVWLRVIRADNSWDLMDKIWIVVTDEYDDDRDDITLGTILDDSPAENRYIHWSSKERPTEHISEIGLWRSEYLEDKPPRGWDGMSNEINEGRGGDSLYIVWKYSPRSHLLFVDS